MIAGAVFAAAAAWLAWPVPAVRRWRYVRPRPADRRIPRDVWIALATGLVAFAVVGPATAVALAAGSVPVGRFVATRWTPRAERRRRERIAAQSPLALDLIAAALAAGRPPVTAFAAVAACTPDPLGAELAAVARRLSVATDPSLVWQQLADGPLAAVGRAFVRTESSGLAAAAVVSDTAAELRRQQNSVRQQTAERLSVTTTVPLGLCFLPAFFLVGIVPMLIGIVGGVLSGLW